VILPLVGYIILVISFKSVLFPLPLTPIKATVSPRFIFRLTFFSTSCLPTRVDLLFQNINLSFNVKGLSYTNLKFLETFSIIIAYLLELVFIFFLDIFIPLLSIIEINKIKSFIIRQILYQILERISNKEKYFNR